MSGLPHGQDIGVESEGFVPARFTDGQLNLPESGNGIPDLLDEAAVQVDFFRKTQTPDGGHKIGTFTHGSATRTFDYAGKSERLDDGEFRYGYDEKGRLIWVAEEPVPISPIRLQPFRVIP